LVINTKSIHDARSEKYQVILSVGPVLLSVFTKLIWDR